MQVGLTLAGPPCMCNIIFLGHFVFLFYTIFGDVSVYASSFQQQYLAPLAAYVSGSMPGTDINVIFQIGNTNILIIRRKKGFWQQNKIAKITQYRRSAGDPSGDM